MKTRLLTRLVATAAVAALALASPVLARGGGGGGGGHGGFGGGHFGGGHFGAMGGAGLSAMGATHFSGMGATHFGPVGGPRFVGSPMARTAFAPRFAGSTWHGRPFIGRHAFFFHHHHHFRRFAVFGASFYGAGYYDGCWRRSWTPYGWRWVNVCGDYWY